MVNIRDVARRSGYSVATVSRVLTSHGYVATETRAKIEAVMQELNYVPNAVAQDLSIGKTQNVGVVLPHTDHPYYTQLVHGITSAAFQAGYQITLLPSHYDLQTEADYLKRLRQKLFDALIFTSRATKRTKLASLQSWGRIVICDDPGNYPLNAVYPERQPGYLHALHWLLDRNCSKIGFLFSRPEDQSATTKATLAAFKTVFGSHVTPSFVRINVNTYADGYQVGQTLLAKQEIPNAIFSNGAHPSAGILQVFKDAHLPVPIIINQENQLAGRLMQLPTLDSHLTELGQKAFELAISDPDQPIQIPITTTFKLPSEHYG